MSEEARMEEDELELEVYDHEGIDDESSHFNGNYPGHRHHARTKHGGLHGVTRSLCKWPWIMLETMLRRRVLTAVIVGALIVLVTFFSALRSRGDRVARLWTQLAGSMRDPEIDLQPNPDNLFYTHRQCHYYFPDLYAEVQRSVLYHSKNGGISKKDVDHASSIYEGREGMVQFQIIKNKLYITKFNGEHRLWTRVVALLHAIDRALTTSPEEIPDLEATFTDRDEGISMVPAWVLDRKAEDEIPWLMPDYGFWSWPEPKVGSYDEVRRQGLQIEEKMSWNMKIPKIFWRGADMTQLRKDLIGMTKSYSWSDIRKIDWHNLGKGDRYSMGEHCQFKYLAHVEGETYSGRLKYLLNCKSVVVMHTLKWVQHFHHLLVSSGPTQNVVVVPGKDFDNLASTMETLIKSDQDAQRIAENAWKDLRQRYLSPAATNCYWRELFDGYASIITFKPKLTDRSVPYESAIIMGTDTWDAYR